MDRGAHRRSAAVPKRGQARPNRASALLLELPRFREVPTGGGRQSVSAGEADAWQTELESRAPARGDRVLACMGLDGFVSIQGLCSVTRRVVLLHQPPQLRLPQPYFQGEGTGCLFSPGTRWLATFTTSQPTVRGSGEDFEEIQDPDVDDEVCVDWAALRLQRVPQGPVEVHPVGAVVPRSMDVDELVAWNTYDALSSEIAIADCPGWRTSSAYPDRIAEYQSRLASHSGRAFVVAGAELKTRAGARRDAGGPREGGRCIRATRGAAREGRPGGAAHRRGPSTVGRRVLTRPVDLTCRARLENAHAGIGAALAARLPGVVGAIGASSVRGAERTEQVGRL
jgi:hypothetical protein